MILQIERLREWLMSLRGWRRWRLAIFLGALTALTLPPFHIWPLLLPSFVGLSWLIDGSRAVNKKRRISFIEGSAWSAFSVGWWFGLGFFLAGLYWISFSFLVDPKTFAWMIPLALLCLSGGMALYVGIVGWAVYISSPQGIRRVFNLALFWVLFEWIRGWAFSGFPWNLIGTVWTISEPMIQVASVTGVLGLSLFTMVAAVAPAIFGNKDIPKSKRWIFTSTAWMLLVVIWVGGYVRLSDVEKTNMSGIILRLVQPNIPQADKWKPELLRAHFDKLLTMSTDLGQGEKRNPTHIIWPETATPFFLERVPEALQVIAAVTPEKGAIITGALRRKVGPGIVEKSWNSIHVIDSRANIKDTYNKHHLVPFGEFVPFRHYLTISSIAGGRKDFSPGVGLKTLTVPGSAPVIPLICYEAIFPIRARQSGSLDKAGWLLNLTNDAWFGFSTGPYQHFAASQFRSVEEGLPLVRVANTGLSGVVDSYGRIRIVTKLNEETVVDSDLPTAIVGKTWFSKYGNKTVLFLILVCYLLFSLKRFSA